MQKYVKKSRPVHAQQFLYEHMKSYKNGVNAVAYSFAPDPPVIQATSKGLIYQKENNYYIETSEGDMLLADGDWIIEGVDGKLYLCKKEIFEKTYVEYKE